MPKCQIHRNGSECDGLADGGVTRTAGLLSSVFNLLSSDFAKATSDTSVVGCQLWALDSLLPQNLQQASPYPKNTERGSFVSGISYN